MVNKTDSLSDEWMFGEPKAQRPYSARRYLSLALIILALLSFLAFREQPAEIRLGLDLRGGTTIILQPQLTEVGEITPEAVRQAVEILRQRVDGVGVSESEIRAEGSGSSTKIIVSVPGTSERELVNLVGQTAKLSIRPVLYFGSAISDSATAFPDYITQEERDAFIAWTCPDETTSTNDDIDKFLVACDQPGSVKYLLQSTKVEGSQISDANAGFDQGGLGWVSNLNFDSEGRANFGELSTEVTKLPPPRNSMAIVLDGKVVTAPRIDGPLTGGNVTIYGGFSEQYARDLANILKYGALPFSFRIDEVEQISPSLGASQLKSGLTAGALGLTLISIYLLFYYRALGLLAIGSLIIAFVISLLLFVILGRWIGLTLTLAGIAGAIVSIGVTADSFIVYFERVRDEMRMGASLRVALERGWARAKRTVWIADAVSLLAAAILYIFTTGNVRGFAFTLGITTLIDLFIIYFFTRPLLVALSKRNFFAKGKRLSGLSQRSLGIVTANRKRRLDIRGLGGRLFRGESSVSVVDKPMRWFLTSTALILAAGFSLYSNGLNLGLEFKGGSVNVVTTYKPAPEKARAVLDSIGYTGQSIVQNIGNDKIRVETAQLSNEDATKLAEGLAQTYNVDINTIDSQNIGPSWGAEISRKALTGLFWFIIVLMIYLAFALEIRMAFAAIAAVIHDVFITVGLYAAAGLKVTPAAVIGFLTILGYSLYDTVVVFDKVRENVKMMKRRSSEEYKKAVNLALNQTLIRSINTSVVAVIPIASILIIGAIFLKAETLKDISLALVIGQTIGTYSSIFIAAPLLVKFAGRSYDNSKGADVTEALISNISNTRTRPAPRGEEFELGTWYLAPLRGADASDLFRITFNNNVAQETLFPNTPVSENLEEFSQKLREYLAKRRENRALKLVRGVASNDPYALIEISVDTDNGYSQVHLNSLFDYVPEKFETLVRELDGYLRNGGSNHVSFLVHDLLPLKEVLIAISAREIGRLESALFTRSGRCDAIMFSIGAGAPKKWSSRTRYEKGERVSYGGKIYFANETIEPNLPVPAWPGVLPKWIRASEEISS